ncbi:uncharacterized protein MELLADRAFT_124127 [Melampsora larici-populina 98AG31]|uniref:Secreted protein n=1 Tax=Melampsora larici-populina (strain 98AG31 / pathotype 3-4-7) TaxID=747676 RepID=F4RXT7_MELLP|nr:uncharacterized protein MELLADRAFT_124127 [Melampsora larici-populina 98AG31]EGG02841.1 secreted protein [Melampsora larici-populina 98AG31]
MLALQTSIIVILSGLISTITCAQQFLVLCTAGLEPFKPASDHNLCKAFSWGDRGEYSRWSCPKVYLKRASGSGCWTIPDHPREQPVSVGKVTCRDTYTFWTDKDKTINGIACRDTQYRRVKCNNMDQAASIDKCDPL